MVLTYFPLLALVSVASIIDIFRQKIPNWIPICIVAIYILSLPVLGRSFEEVATGALFAAFFFAVSFGLWACGAIGGGDQKLMSAIVLWMGFSEAFLTFFLATSLAGAAIAAGVLMLRIINAQISIGIVENIVRISLKKIPYAPAMLVGVIAVLTS